jgi:hypothetical protein
LFKTVQEKIKKETALGIFTDEITFSPLDPEQNTSAGDIFSADLSILHIPQKRRGNFIQNTSHLLDRAASLLEIWS